MKENKKIFPSAEGGMHMPEITDGDTFSQNAQMASYQVEDEFDCTINYPLFECL